MSAQGRTQLQSAYLLKFGHPDGGSGFELNEPAGAEVDIEPLGDLHLVVDDLLLGRDHQSLGGQGGEESGESNRAHSETTKRNEGEVQWLGEVVWSPFKRAQARPKCRGRAANSNKLTSMRAKSGSFLSSPTHCATSP